MAHDPLPVSTEPPRPLEVVRSGYVSFKKDAFASWLWRAKYLVLRDQNLTIHKNEVRALFLLLHVAYTSFVAVRLEVPSPRRCETRQRLIRAHH